MKITRRPEPASEELLCGSVTTREANSDAPLLLPRLTVASLMCTEVARVRSDVSLDALGALFLETALSALPVVDEQERLLGFVERDQLALAVQVEGGEARRPLTVDDLLLPFAVVVPETTSLTQAAAVMVFEGQRRLAVASTRGTVVGVLSASDILAWLARSGGHVLRDSAQTSS